MKSPYRLMLQFGLKKGAIAAKMQRLTGDREGL
jgi:hypothetical protein